MMTYFCAKCQKRHDVKEISADMWNICRPTLRNRVNNRLKELIEEPGDHSEYKTELFDLYNDLLGFLASPNPVVESSQGKHRNAQVNAYFPLNMANCRQRLSGCTINGGVVSGTYNVQLGELLLLLPKWDQQSSSQSLQYVPKAWYSENLLSLPLQAYFQENGVLDKVTDMENVPFTDKTATATMTGESRNADLGYTHICPHCGCVISRAAGRAEEIVVALAGAPRAGKTACMIATLHSLLQSNCPGVRIVPMDNDSKWNNLESEIKNYYKKGKKVEKTPDKITEVPAHSILLEVAGNPRIRKVLTIVDMPGEFWQGASGLTADFFKQYSGIYENIDCIWFVISKATVSLSHVDQIPSFVQEKLRSEVSEDAEIIQKSAPQNLSINLGMLRNHLNLRGKPMPPMIVIVSKPDYSTTQLDEKKNQEYQLFPEENVASVNAEDLARTMKASSKNGYGVAQYPIYEHAQNVRSFIEDTCPAFLSAVEDNCPDRCYAAVSPYGHAAGDRDDLDLVPPVPYHELIPFIWTLAIQGGLTIYQSCKWLKKNFLNIQVSEEHTREAVSFRYTNRNLPVPKRGREKQEIEDRNRFYAAICNNLLMNGRSFVAEVVIPHEKA